MSGWKHMMDLLIRRGLGQCVFFPQFLKHVKAIVSFLREDIDRVTQDLRRRGHTELAKLMRLVSFPTFANWRWSTLDNCLKSISRFVLLWGLPSAHPCSPR